MKDGGAFVDALLYLKFISSDNKVILNSLSMFSGNLDRNIMNFMNDAEELLITFEKDIVEDVHIAASEGIPLTNISVIPNLSKLEAFIDKKHDEYAVWKNKNSLLSRDTPSVILQIEQSQKLMQLMIFYVL